MKLSLKGFDFKAFFLNHAEKIAFGVFGLVTLWALSATEWSRYAGTPEEIQQDVQKHRQRILSSTWPPEMQQSFVLQDYMDRTLAVKAAVPLQKYAFSTNMWWPLYRKQELAKEPELVAVQDLIATPGLVIIGLPSTPPPGSGGVMADSGVIADPLNASSGGAAPGKAVAAAPAGDDDEFKPARAGGGGAAAGALAAGPGMAHGALGIPGGPVGPGPGAAHAMPAAPGGAHGAIPGAGMVGILGIGDSGMAGMMGGGSATSGLKPRGERFVAVRGVWPVWQQLDRYVKALNLQTGADARALLEVLDFVLERQTAVAGADPWSGPWEVVDITRAKEVLAESFDYDVDPVDPRVTDVAITMPLPARLIGRWGDYATHPKITNFVMPQELLERVTKLQEKLEEEYNKYKLKEAPKRVEKAGFAKESKNFRGMANDLFGSQYGDAAMPEMLQAYNEGRPAMAGARPTAPPDLKSQLTAIDKLLLFRYFDFDVRPGYAYRYRVKLKLRNPNFERPPEQVVDPAFTRNPDLTTPDSNISNVAVLPETVNYFVRDIERDPFNEITRSANRTLASLYFYEWDAQVGTMIADPIRLTTIGQFIGEKKKSKRLDVAKPSLKDEEVQFQSDDVLVDLVSDVKLSAEDHKDLKLPAANKGRVGLAPELVVLDHTGQLRTIDPTTNAAREAELRRRVENERKHYKDIEGKDPAAAPAGGGIPGMMPGMDAGAMMEGMLPAGAKVKSKSKKPKTAGGAHGGGGSSSSAF